MIESSTLIWTAGVKGQYPEGLQPDVIQRGNRIKVDRFNKFRILKLFMQLVMLPLWQLINTQIVIQWLHQQQFSKVNTFSRKLFK